MCQANMVETSPFLQATARLFVSNLEKGVPLKEAGLMQGRVPEHGPPLAVEGQLGCFGEVGAW